MENEGQEKIEYVNPPEGYGAYGLQVVKNCQTNVWVRDAQGNRTKSPDKFEDALRFVFRHRTIPNCFINVTVPEKFSAKSNLMSLLSNMTAGKVRGFKYDGGRLVDEGTPGAEIARVIKELPGHWFNVLVGYSGRFAKVLNNSVTPHPQDAEWGNCHDYFGPTKAEIPPPVELKSQTKSSLVSKSTGFESYPDEMCKTTHPYLYDLEKSQRLEAAQMLLKKVSGIQLDDKGFKWRSKERVMQLESYFKPETLEDDDLPF